MNVFFVNNFTRTLNFTKLAVLFLCIFVAQKSAAQDARFTASVDKNSVAVNERFTLEFTLSTNGTGTGRDLKLPNMSNFLVLSGPNQSTSMQIINGAVTTTQSYSYILQPRSEGTFKIAEASITVDGKEYRSQPVTITVSKSSTQSKQQAPQSHSDEIEIGDNLFLRAVVDRSKVYQGEQVTVTYKVFTRLRIVNYQINKLPTMTGFWGEDLQMPQQVQLSTEVINGKQYQVGTLKKTALFPTQSGTLEINPMEITCQVQLQSRRRSNDIFDQFFNDPFFGATQTANVEIKSLPLKITVLPLPNTNVPESYRGAVGKFSLNASLTKKTAKTNEPISLKATITGSGNVKVLEAPKLELPQDFEVYDPKVNENISRTGSEVSGTKTFEWLIVPRYPGEKRIPPLEFSYFDIERKKYVTLKTNEFNVLVEKGSAEASSVASGFSKTDVKLLNQDIRFIKTESGSFSRRGEEIISSTLFAVLTGIPLGAFILLLFVKRKSILDSADVVKFRSRRAIKLAAKRLNRAKTLLASNASEEFYAEVSSALWQYVSDKLAIDRAELSIDNVTQKLNEKKISSKLVAKIQMALEACEFARFAPASSSQEEKNKMYDTANAIIVATEKELM